MNNTERRRARRIADALELQIYPESAPAQNNPQLERATRFVRLSTTGLQVIDDNALRSEQRVRLVMQLSADTTLHLTGRVVDTGEVSSDRGQQRYYNNIGFIDVPDDARELLHSHVERVFRQTHSAAG